MVCISALKAMDSCRGVFKRFSPGAAPGAALAASVGALPCAQVWAVCLWSGHSSSELGVTRCLRHSLSLILFQVQRGGLLIAALSLPGLYAAKLLLQVIYCHFDAATPLLPWGEGIGLVVLG